jgi:cysteine synthase B
MGTSGTLMGVAAFLRGKNPSVSILGVEPTLGHNIQGLKNMSESIVPGLFDPGVLDRKVVVRDEEAYEMSKKVASEEGIFCGMSSGAVVHAALDLARNLESGTIVGILPDRGDRYLTTVLYCNERCRTALCQIKHCRKCLGADPNP